MARWSVAVVALAGCLLLPSCDDGPEGSARDFRLSPGDARVFEAYQQSVTTLHRRVDLRPGTRHVRVRIDCVNAGGAVSVDVLAGKALMQCTEDAATSSVVGLEWQRGLSGPRPAAVRVRAPKGAVWSVAVDAGPGGISADGD